MSDSPIISIKGHIVREDIEGGFWGIRASDGSNYVPLAPLDQAFCKNGLQISAEIELVSVFSTTMWGKHVRIHSMQVT